MMDSRVMKMRRRQFGAVCVAVLLGIALTSWSGGALPPGVDYGAYALRVYQRVIAVGIHLLKLEEEWIFSLKKGRPLDLERVVCRYRSAREQIRNLRKFANFLEKRVPSSDPRLAKIQSMKGRIPSILQGHRKNIVTLNGLTGGKLAQVTAMLTQACEPTEPQGAVGSFPVTTIDEGF